MTRRTIKLQAGVVEAERKRDFVSLTLHDVDVTDFLDAEMAVEEIDHRDLLNAMDEGDVADWLRGQGYQVEED